MTVWRHVWWDVCRSVGLAVALHGCTPPGGSTRPNRQQTSRRISGLLRPAGPGDAGARRRSTSPSRSGSTSSAAACSRKAGHPRTGSSRPTKGAGVQRSCQCRCARLPRVLTPEHMTAGVGLGTNQGHAGGLTVPQLVIRERADEIVHTDAKRLWPAGRPVLIARYARQRRSRLCATVGLVRRCADVPLGGDQQAQYPRSAPTATFKQASRWPMGADPQQAVL